MMSVRPERRDKKENGHACAKEGTCLVIILLVLKKQIDDHAGHIGEPQQIGNYEHLAEGYVVVQTDMDDLIILYIRLFQPCKPYQIDNHIQQNRYGVFIFMIKIFHSFRHCNSSLPWFFLFNNLSIALKNEIAMPFLAFYAILKKTFRFGVMDG